MSRNGTELQSRPRPRPETVTEDSDEDAILSDTKISGEEMAPSGITKSIQIEVNSTQRGQEERGDEYNNWERAPSEA